MHVCIPRSKRQTINGDAYSNASRRKTNLHSYVYLVLSVRQAVETLVTKNKTTCSCIPRYKPQTSNGDAYSNASRRKTNLHVHVYLVLSVRRAITTILFRLFKRKARMKIVTHRLEFLLFKGKHANRSGKRK